jgi:HSP20 family protein
MQLMKVNQGLFPAFSNLWEDFLGKDIMDIPKESGSIPAVNIVEKPDKFLVHLAVPGMDRKNLKINIENGILTVSAEKEDKKEEKEDKFTRREFCFHSFKRSFTLPEFVQEDKVEAKYENGILEICLPKHEQAKVKPVKQIEVK